MLGVIAILAVIAGMMLWAGKAEAPEEEIKFEEPSFIEREENTGGQVILREEEEENNSKPSSSPLPGGNDDAAFPTPLLPGGSVPTDESEAAELFTVTIQDTGFEPAEAVVNVNTKVTWVNNGQALHQPQGEGFGAESGLPTGGEYSFVFTEAGEYEYLDALMPELTGKVIVK